MPKPKVCFLYSDGRSQRLSSESFPTEFFYGLPEIDREAFDVDLLEEAALQAGDAVVRASRLSSAIFHRVFGLSLASLRLFGRKDVLEKLNAHDVLVATKNSQGLALAALKAVGKLRSNVVFVTMGTWPTSATFSQRVVFRRLLRLVGLAPISRAETDYLAERLPGKRDIEDFTFGVDRNFWSPGPEDEVGDYVLSIGNDWSRDYATLSKAWAPDFPPLKVVTSLKVPPSDGPVEVISGDWRRQLLSDEEIRELFRRARFVVLPLRQTIQPSGQSACLQAMACGKAVVLSDIQGLWSRELMIDGKSCVLFPPGSPDGLAGAVKGLLDAPEKVAAIGLEARKVVEDHLNTERMARELSGFISKYALQN